MIRATPTTVGIPLSLHQMHLLGKDIGPLFSFSIPNDCLEYFDVHTCRFNYWGSEAALWKQTQMYVIVIEPASYSSESFNCHITYKFLERRVPKRVVLNYSYLQRLDEKWEYHRALKVIYGSITKTTILRFVAWMNLGLESNPTQRSFALEKP